MKLNKTFSRCLAIAAMLMTTASAQAESTEKLLAFPGAEGFGRYVTGGRGGAVYIVNTLEDTGKAGSLRYACNQSGKRTIVFTVSGTIFLKSELRVSKGDLTIAGQTAPGDGICIADYPFVIAANNVILRYLHIRLGNRNVANHEGDGLGIDSRDNIMVDHCSVSWSIDECLSVYGGRNTTVQWCIVTQPLVEAGHSKEIHGYGGNWGGSGASFHHNLIAHGGSRTPRLGPKQRTQLDERMDMRNNVIYNWSGNGCYGGEGMNVNIVNNYYKPGPATLKKSTSMQQRIAGIGIRTTSYCKNKDGSWNGWYPMHHVWGKFYVDGNVNTKHSNVTKDNWTYGMYNQIDASGNDGTYTQKTKDTLKITAPIPYVAVTTHSAEDAYERVVQNVGCIMKKNGEWVRDHLDATVVDDTRNGAATYTGSSNEPGMVDSQDEAGGWPELESTTPPTDSDLDGMPDEWETANGLDPNFPLDRNDKNSEGYTNLEVYLNSLVKEITERQYAGGTLLGYSNNTDGTKTEHGYVTAINDIVKDSSAQPRFHDTNIYSLSGNIIVRNADESDYSKLSKGVYIHNERKIVIR